jgi:polyphosphate kinase 2 (PPK2 family)
MLELIDLSREMSRSEFRLRLPRFQQQMLEVEEAIASAGIPVIIVVEGWATANKGGVIRTLTSRMDPRGYRVVTIGAPREHENNFPWMHRFWLRLPNYGEIVIFDQSWYRRLLEDRVEERVPKKDWKRAFAAIRNFERTLADDGTVIIKFFLHISRKEQARRLRKLLSDKTTGKLVSKEDRAQQKKYPRYLEAAEEMLSQTEAEWAPWTIVEANSGHFARHRVFETVLQRLQHALRAVPDKAPAAAPAGR